MAVTNADILGWLNANPGANPALISETMKEAGVSSAQYQFATGLALPTATASTPIPLPVSVADTSPPVRQASTQPQAAPTAPQDGMLTGPAQAPTVPSVTDADILGWLNENRGASDALIAQTMQQAGVTPVRLAQLTGAPVSQVSGLFQQAIATPATSAPKTITDLYQQELGRLPESKAVVDEWKRIFGDTIEPSEVDVFKQATQLEKTNPTVANIKGQILAQGTTDKWTGEGKGSAEANAADMASILSGIGITDISQFGKLPDGNFGNKVTGQAVPNTYSERQTGNAFGGTFAGKGNTGYRVEFDAQGNPLFYTTGASSSNVPGWVIPALAIGGAIYGLGGLEGLLAEAPATLGVTGAQGAFLGEGVLSGIAASDAALAAAGGLGAGFTAAGLPSGAGTFLGEGVASGIPAFDTAFTSAGGLFNPAFGLPVGNGAFIGEGVPTGIPASDAAYLNAGGTFNPAYLAPAIPTAISGGGVSSVAIPTGVPPTGLPSSVVNAGISTAINKIIGGGGTSNIPNLISGGLGTAGNLLQMQESREAAQRAQARIDAETAAAKASAAFRPIGMTTRFGTSQFQVDPVTGQLTSAGYTLSPEAKAQQDRFMALSQQGLTQAEQAQAQFAPLQTGAQRLFGLGNQYLAQSPEAVAQNYLNQQMALLQPGREQELANLQNRLQQQGRGGLAVAQGGAYGATTPELQALYNARAQQEAQLAANAQQYGQQQVAFGAGLLGTGAQTMGQYYGGQQAAYAPYTTAMGQVQGLEALGQQPFTLGAQLGQTASTAGARVGQLGLQGAGQSVALATGADATRNLGAQSLIAAGNPNAQFGSAIGGLLGGGLQSAFSGTGLGASGFGTGLAFGNQDLGLYL